VKEFALFMVYLHSFALLFYVPLVDFNDVHILVPLFLLKFIYFFKNLIIERLKLCLSMVPATFFCKS